jgi:membrane-associated phospholipid phosphatase
MRGLSSVRSSASGAANRPVRGRPPADRNRPASAGEVARYALPRLLGGGVAVYAFLAICGLLLTRVLDHSELARSDQSVSRWFFKHRTEELNSWTHIGSSMSDTPYAILLTVVLVAGLRLWLHRWRESIAIFLSIQGELFIFLLVTSTINRQRPSVPHLDPAPPTSSFPSGHVGAAVALYVGFAVLLLGLSRTWSSPIPARVVAAVVCLIPVAVALSRLYRGMHFLTDVLAGAIAGGLWMAIVMVTVLRAPSLHWKHTAPPRRSGRGRVAASRPPAPEAAPASTRRTRRPTPPATPRPATIRRERRSGSERRAPPGKIRQVPPKAR